MTTPIAAQPIVAAVESAVTAQGLPFGDGAKPDLADPTVPYIVGWFDAGMHSDSSLAGRDGWSVTLTAHCVGLTAEASRIAAAKLAAALYSLAGTTAGGRQLWCPDQITALPVARDDDADPKVWDALVEWRIDTSPA